MNVSYYFKNLTPTDALKEYAGSKLKRFYERLNHLRGVEVRFKLERQNQFCEITLYADSMVYHSKKKAKDLYASIDTCVDSLQNQIDKYHKKLDTIRMDISKKIPIASSYKTEDADTVTIYDAPVKPMNDLEAILQLKAHKYRFYMFHTMNEKRYSLAFIRLDGNFSIIAPAEKVGEYWEHVVKIGQNELIELSTTLYPLSELSIPEAIEKLKEDDLEYLTFLNDESKRMNVLFYSRDNELLIKRPGD